LFSARIDVLTQPFSKEKHMVFTNILYKYVNREQAERELTISQSLSSSKVLGAWDENVNKLMKSYAFWQQVIVQKPDYRDAYIQLASLAFELDRTEEAKNYLAQALVLDPNNRDVKSAEQQLGL